MESAGTNAEPEGQSPPEAGASPQDETLIEKWVYGGSGLGRMEGKVVLVPFVLPGELVRVKPRRTRSGLIEADLAAVIAPSEHRIEAACPYFRRCGGCHYQHTSYEFQLEQKRAILVEVLRRVGKLQAPEEIAIIAGPPWEYRNRVQIHFKDQQLGYREGGSHELCPIEKCPIASPRLGEAITALRAMMLQRRFPGFIRGIELFTNEQETLLNVLEATGSDRKRVARSFFDWAAERIPGATAGWLEMKAAGEHYRVGHSSFFQVNRFLTDALVECALPASGGGTAMDLYAGVGLFSIPLARRFAKVIAVESNRSALRDLALNSERAGVPVQVEPGSVDLVLESMTDSPDFVLADPPRTGLGKSAVKQLIRLRPRNLTIVSCDPATLARDLSALVGAGFRIESIAMIDLFPQTFHIETVTRLVIS